MDVGSVRSIQIDEQAGQRIDNFLFGTLKGVPRGRIYRMIRTGEVRINGSRCKAHTRLTANDTVRVPPVRQANRSGTPEISQQIVRQIERSVIYEDDFIMVIDKPSGIAAHAGTGVSFGIAELLAQTYDSDRVQIAHRLDRETSGCLVVAKTRAMLNELHRQFRANLIQKRYTLIVEGRWPVQLTNVDAPLHRYLDSEGDRRVRVVEGGKSATTDFEVERRCHVATWLSAIPNSGRTHQIRVHTQHVGHPILGDRKYGNRHFLPRPPRVLLHAERINLPSIGEVHAPIPAAFDKYWIKLKEGD